MEKNLLASLKTPRVGIVLAAMIIGGCFSLALSDKPWPAPERQAPATEVNHYQVAQDSIILVKSNDSYGTGFVVRRGETLFAWTANHVTANSDKVTISHVLRKHNRKVGSISYSARVISRDVKRDISLLWIDAPANAFPSVEFDGVNALPLGTLVYHSGNYYGPLFEGSVSVGIVSQIGVSVGSPGWPWSVVDQTTCGIFPGSSGGPLFRSDTHTVVGVVVGMAAPGLGFFVPNRALHASANENHVEFAFLTSLPTPNESALNALADSVKRPTPAVIPPAAQEVTPSETEQPSTPSETETAPPETETKRLPAPPEIKTKTKRLPAPVIRGGRAAEVFRK